jgi:hypothetical protein
MLPLRARYTVASTQSECLLLGSRQLSRRDRVWDRVEVLGCDGLERIAQEVSAGKRVGSQVDCGSAETSWPAGCTRRLQ